MRLWDKLGLDMDRHRVVALVGGGGKTTTMYALAREAREAGKTVIVTTTTHILPHPGLFMTDENEPAALKKLLDQYGILTVGRLDRKDKMTGGDVAACAAAADIVLSEADGARVRPLKAPADHEPVIPPQAAAVLALAGMDCLGRTVGDICHRPERVCALLGHLLSTLKALLCGLFAWITVWSALAWPLPVWFLPAALGAVSGDLISWFVRVFRAQ